MKRTLIDLLACPSCRGELSVAGGGSGGREFETALLRCAGCSREYPVVSGIPRFVPADNYASSFGLQWNRFSRTQLDSHSGLTISRDRFFRQTGWGAADLAGARVLDVGCGAGRFAEIALGCGAEVTAVDYSTAVDACRANLNGADRLHVVQADIYQLPFRAAAFDFVYCFGVLQHTPDVKRAFMALPAQVKPGCRLAVDVYPKHWVNIVWPKYWLRPVTRHIPAQRLFPVIDRLVRLLWPVSLAVGRIPWAGRRLRYAIPIANYEGVYPLSPQQLREWAVLDTYDMFAPAHDHPQTLETLRAWLEEAGLQAVHVFRSGFLVGRGIKP